MLFSTTECDELKTEETKTFEVLAVRQQPVLAAFRPTLSEITK